MNGISKYRERGLTLVEVLVAFAILAGVVVSVMGLIGQNTRYIVSAEERMLASVAADNMLTEELVQLASPNETVEEGETTIASRTFVYRRSVIELGNGVAQIEYAVRRPGGDQTLARASALKGP